MHVELHPRYSDNTEAKRAGELISACVHCGLCLATCPTYLDTGDERDSPRGRIYLLKQLLEEGEAGAVTRTHLDRCLSCRSCETACPSGMQYGKLADIGRGMLNIEAPRGPVERLFRFSLRQTLSRPVLVAALLRIGQLFRPLLPPRLKRKIPLRQTPGAMPVSTQPRTMLALSGCVQSAATPLTHAAAARVLDRLGISLKIASEAGCCGAVNYHLGAHSDGLDNMRRNIDAWWPMIEAGAEAIISSATGCGSILVEYGDLLQHDSVYAAKAKRVSALCRDIADVLVDEDLTLLNIKRDIGRVAVHTPCSQQHALKQPDIVNTILRRAGFTLAKTRDDHLCCGSAGTYSILQRSRSERLRQRKLEALQVDNPALIVSANVGCQLHLDEESKIPVKHWIELLDPLTHQGH
ncbi:MAG: glycolate oxidase subunit GlcF [Halioglobus sp.]|nr:glycolate oxidase subunit GlcF [Halioglobus sp.]MDG2328408.1 glycolate oxidase subunit GlcF [Halioglobus sp.]